MSEPLTTETWKSLALSWIAILIALMLAFPFGWGLGVLIAPPITYLITGGWDFGQLPAMTVPIGIVASLIFAILPTITIRTRLAVLFFGSVAFFVVGWITG